MTMQLIKGGPSLAGCSSDGQMNRNPEAWKTQWRKQRGHKNRGRRWEGKKGAKKGSIKFNAITISR